MLCVFLGVGILCLLLCKKLGKWLEVVFVLYLIAILAILITAYYGDVPASDSSTAFYIGYSFAMLFRIVGFGVVRFHWMVVLTIFITAINPSKKFKIVSQLIGIALIHKNR